MRERLEHARALERTGKYADGTAVVEALEKESRPLGYPPLTAEVLLVKGILLSQGGKFQEATEVLEEADHLAATVKHVQASAQALCELVNVVGFWIRRFDEGIVRGRYALNFLLHHSLMDKQGARLLSSMGLVMRRKGEFDRAVEYQKQALELCVKQMPREQCHVYVWHLGADYYYAGRLQESESNFLQSIKDAEAVLGPSHPELGKAMNNLSLLLCDLGRYDEALHWVRRALTIFEQAYGKDHAQVGDAVTNLANTLWWKGEYQQALPFHQQSLDIRAKVFGAEHAFVGESHLNLGSDYLELGNLGLARHHVQKSLELFTRLLGPEHVNTCAARALVARLVLKDGKPEQAQAELDAVIASLTKALGPDHPNLVEAYLYRAQVAYARKDYAKARTLLEDALKIHHAKNITNKFTASMHLELAKTLWLIPGATSRTDARDHAEKAAEILARFGGARTETARELDEWLSQHQP